MSVKIFVLLVTHFSRCSRCSMDLIKISPHDKDATNYSKWINGTLFERHCAACTHTAWAHWCSVMLPGLFFYSFLWVSLRELHPWPPCHQSFSVINSPALLTHAHTHTHTYVHALTHIYTHQHVYMYIMLCLALQKYKSKQTISNQ